MSGVNKHHPIDKNDIRDLGFHPRAASVIRAKELVGHGSVPMAIVQKLHSLQELLRQASPMLTAVLRADQLWIAGGVSPRCDPPVRYVQEREGELCVWVGVLLALGHFLPGVAGIGAMDNDDIHSTSIILGANRPHFATTDELNPSQPGGDLAFEAFTLTPGQSEGSIRRF
jgi:hypothetical protein